MIKRVLVVAVLGALMAGMAARPAGASQVVWWDSFSANLAVSRTGKMAMMTFRTREGRVLHVLAWGAENAYTPNHKVAQQRFKLDYSGGSGTFHRQVWRTFHNYCRPYDGPKLAWFVAACKAPDGSYWAVQRFQTALPGLGYLPWVPRQIHWWLRLSHWTGPTAQFEVYTDWIYVRIHEIFGRLTYRGQPVYGFKTTHNGIPLDGYERLLYLDTFNSRYGDGWRRENAFVTHNPLGTFCYSFWPRNAYRDGYEHPPHAPNVDRPPGNGKMYRITVMGPGVTPDVMWMGPGLPEFDPHNADDVALEQTMNQTLDRIAHGDRQCRHH